MGLPGKLIFTLIYQPTTQYVCWDWVFILSCTLKVLDFQLYKAKVQKHQPSDCLIWAYLNLWGSAPQIDWHWQLLKVSQVLRIFCVLPSFSWQYFSRLLVNGQFKVTSWLLSQNQYLLFQLFALKLLSISLRLIDM